MNLQFERHSFRFGWPSRIALLACVLILAVAFFPIRFLSSSVAKMTNCQVVLLQPEGTIWQGSTQLGLSAIKSATSETCPRPQVGSERFSWKSQFSVFDLQSKWVIQYVNTMKPLELTVHPRAITLSSNQIELPANLLEVAGGILRTLNLRGKLDIRWDDLVWDGAPRGLVEVKFLNVASPISPIKPLGSYALTLQINQPLRFDFSTINGPLLLTAKGGVDRGRLSLQGEATAAPESIDSLIGLLSIIGNRDGAIYRFKI
jgi:general secretion pathway protein N